MEPRVQLQEIKAAVVHEKDGPFELETLQLDEPRANEVLVRVVATGIFAPWNAPLALGIRSLAPALAAGCAAAVILPKETAQVNALIGELISETEVEGGFKQSGPGRLRGQAGLDDFLECKHVAFRPGAIKHESRAGVGRFQPTRGPVS